MDLSCEKHLIHNFSMKYKSTIIFMTRPQTYKSTWSTNPLGLQMGESSSRKNRLTTCKCKPQGPHNLVTATNEHQSQVAGKSWWLFTNSGFQETTLRFPLDPVRLQCRVHQLLVLIILDGVNCVQVVQMREALLVKLQDLGRCGLVYNLPAVPLVESVFAERAAVSDMLSYDSFLRKVFRHLLLCCHFHWHCPS